MSANKTDILAQLLSQKDEKTSEVSFLIDEIIELLISKTKSSAVFWNPYSMYFNNNTTIPKKMKWIIEREAEEGRALSQDKSFFLEYNGFYFFSVCFRRVGTDRICAGLIVTSSSPDSNDGSGTVNSEKAMRLYNLIRYNMNAQKKTDCEDQTSFLNAVYESLSNKQSV